MTDQTTHDVLWKSSATPAPASPTPTRRGTSTTGATAPAATSTTRRPATWLRSRAPSSTGRTSRTSSAPPTAKSTRLLGLDPAPAALENVDAYGQAISNATMTRSDAKVMADVKREHALSLIDDAITALEAEYERNRLDVLAQAQRIVDNAQEPVLA